jgi:hypothetical protein
LDLSNITKNSASPDFNGNGNSVRHDDEQCHYHMVGEHMQIATFSFLSFFVRMVKFSLKYLLAA